MKKKTIYMALNLDIKSWGKQGFIIVGMSWNLKSWDARIKLLTSVKIIISKYNFTKKN